MSARRTLEFPLVGLSVALFVDPLETWKRHARGHKLRAKFDLETDSLSPRTSLGNLF